MATRVIDVIYPARCMICEIYTDAPGGLCPDCWSDTAFIAGAACKKCGSPLPGSGEDLLCDSCINFPPVWNRGAAALLYAGGGRKLVLALKHGDRLDLAPTLARWMQTPARQLLSTTDVIIPVPLHRFRLRKRKYNQTNELARNLARLSAKTCIPDLLVRHRRTPSQDGLNREERLENQRGAFRIHPRHHQKAASKSVLIVDDVMTTGATLSCCAEVLYKAGAEKVNIIVLARVERGL